MKILLIAANPLAVPYPVYPVGLDYVAAALGDGHEVARADVLGPDGRGGVLEAVKATGPALIGIALRNIDNSDASESNGFAAYYRALVKDIRAVSQAPIVLGGPAFTIAPEAYMALLGADYGLVGEGERLRALADALEAGRPPAGLPGLVQGQGASALPEPLPKLPPRRLPRNPAWLSPYLSHGGMLSLQTQRGCPYRCIYCTYPHIEGRRLRRGDPEEVGEAALALQRAGARFIFITDAAFNADETHSLAVARALRTAGVSVPWGAYFVPRTTSTSFWKTLAASGLTHVEFGTESLAPAMLRSLQKPFDPDRAVGAHEAAVGAGLSVAHFFMLGAPGETEATLRESFAAAGHLRGAVCFFFSAIRIFPGTTLHERALQQGRITPDDDLLEPTFWEPQALGLPRLGELAREGTAAHGHFVLGSGGARLAALLDKLYALGHTGPLWERLIP